MFDVATVIQQFPIEIFKAIAVPPPINGFDRASKVAADTTEEEAREAEAFFNTVTVTERVFLDTLYTGRSVPLTPATKIILLDALKSVIIGTRTCRTGGENHRGYV